MTFAFYVLYSLITKTNIVCIPLRKKEVQTIKKSVSPYVTISPLQYSLTVWRDTVAETRHSIWFHMTLNKMQLSYIWKKKSKFRNKSRKQIPIDKRNKFYIQNGSKFCLWTNSIKIFGFIEMGKIEFLKKIGAIKNSLNEKTFIF